MQESSWRKKRNAIILTGVAGVLWGTSFPAIQLGLNYMDPYTFVFLRFTLAAVIMLLIVLAKNGHKLEFEKNKIIWFLGITNGIAYLLQYVGMQTTSASRSALLVNLTAIWVAILSSLILKEKLGTKKTLGILFGILGVFLITTNLDFKTLGQGAIIGDMLVLLSGVAWAFFTVYNKKWVSDTKEMIQPIMWVYIITLLPLIPALFFSHRTPFQLPTAAWLTIVYTAVFCWVIPFYVWSKALKTITAASSTIILLSEVIVAMAISAVFLPNNSLTLVSGIGALAIIAAIILAS